METFAQALEWVQNVAFVAVGVWAVLQWRRRDDVQAAWLAATFGSLSGVVVLSTVSDAVDATGVQDVVQELSIVVLALFPYMLARFMDTFEPISRALRRGILVVALGLASWGLFLDLPEEGDPRSTVVNLFVLAFVAYWFALLGAVSWRFWRGSRGQPTLTRRRLRILSLASFTLGLVLLLAGASGADPAPGVTVLTRILGLTSALAFAVGFIPPATLRVAWRQPEENKLYEASVGLMTATSSQEVGEVLAPHVRAVTGASAVAIVEGTDVIGHVGIELPEARAAAVAEQPDDQALEVVLDDGRFLIWADRYTPFFGTEEMHLLDRLALLADLGLARAHLIASEREARRELEATNRELEAFVYTASHDLKSPLIAMLGYLEVIDSEYRDRLGEEGDWYVERMLTNGRYMEALIGDLLELSRVGRMQTEPDLVDLRPVVEGVADELAPRYPDATYVVEELPELWVNPVRVRQLLGNLMENAGKYGGEDVTVTISSRELDDGGIELRVHDDGIGIPEAYAEKVFGVFERLDADDSKSGTGIGLAICRKIVESIGGEIWLAESDVGADFRIRLPATTTRSQASTPSSTSQEVPA